MDCINEVTQLYPCWRKEQGEFIENRFNVWAIGNRAGSTFAAMELGSAHFAVVTAEGGRCKWWIVAPSERLAKVDWRCLKKQIHPRELVKQIDEKTMTIATFGGGEVRVLSAQSMPYQNDESIDILMVSDAARINGLLRMVDKFIETCLNKEYGKVLVYGTPNGTGDFYKLFLRGRDGKKGMDGWHSINLPWTSSPDNQRLADMVIQTKQGLVRYEDNLRRRMGERRFQHAYLARFKYSLLIEIKHKFKMLFGLNKKRKQRKTGIGL